MVAGCGQPQEHLQEAVHVGCRQEIAAAGDVAHPLERIIDDHREVVARRHILAHNHHIPPALGPSADE